MGRTHLPAEVRYAAVRAHAQDKHRRFMDQHPKASTRSKLLATTRMEAEIENARHTLVGGVTPEYAQERRAYWAAQLDFYRGPAPQGLRRGKYQRTPHSYVITVYHRSSRPGEHILETVTVTGIDAMRAARSSIRQRHRGGYTLTVRNLTTGHFISS